MLQPNSAKLIDYDMSNLRIYGIVNDNKFDRKFHACQALRTLFNIAHRLHNVLGPSWVLVCPCTFHTYMTLGEICY